MSYQHTQLGKLHLIVLAPILILLITAYLGRSVPEALLINLATSLLLIFIAFCFRSLHIRDDGHHLTLRYGPIPLFHKRFPYAQMTAVQPARSSFLDGWGIHYMPGKGWLYNLWGRNCIQIQMGKKTVRIGTDDVPGLLAFLQSKISPANQ